MTQKVANTESNFLKEQIFMAFVTVSAKYYRGESRSGFRGFRYCDDTIRAYIPVRTAVSGTGYSCIRY